MLLWKHFVDVINIYNQLSWNKKDYPKCGQALSNQLKTLRAKNWSFLQKKEFFLKIAMRMNCLTCSMDFGLTSPYNRVSQFLKHSFCTHMYTHTHVVSVCLSLISGPHSSSGFGRDVGNRTRMTNKAGLLSQFKSVWIPQGQTRVAHVVPRS